MNGFLYRNRHYFAVLGERFPRITKRLIRGRTIALLAYGWPITAAGVALYLFHIIAVQLIVFAPRLPWLAIIFTTWGAVSTVLVALFTVGGAIVTAILVGLAAFNREKISEGLQIVWRFWPVYILASWTFSTIYAAIRTGPVLAVIMVLMPLAAWAVDAIFGIESEELRVRRLWAEFRREYPVVWAIMASKSPRVQSLDQDTEDSVERVATNRPLLEAPPLSILAKFEGSTVECGIARAPGRTLVEVQDVMDEMAAQYPTISDKQNSMQVIWADGSQSRYASQGTLRIEFKSREELSQSRVLNKIRRSRNSGEMADGTDIR